MSVADLFWLAALFFFLGPLTLTSAIWTCVLAAGAFAEREGFLVIGALLSGIGTFLMCLASHHALVQIGIMS